MDFQVSRPKVTAHVATSVLLSRPSPCRDIYSHVATSPWSYCSCELVVLDVLTSSCALTSFSGSLMMSRHHGLVVTSTLVSCSPLLLFLVSRHQDVVVTSLHTFCSSLLVVTMSRHCFSCRDITVRLCRLYWCRDIKFLVATTAPGTMPLEQVSPFVVTSA